MSESYENILHPVTGEVIGKILVSTPDTQPEPDAKIPRDDFISRFTPQEWLAGQNRALTDANLSFALALLMGKPDGMVALTSPRVTQALGYMATIGILTPKRAAEIGAVT